jgi:hypothetical protein
MDLDPQIAKLTKVLESVGPVTIQGCHTDKDDNAYGQLAYPEGLASLIVHALADGDGLLVMPSKLSTPRVILPGPEPDPEVAAMAAIVAAMDRLDDEAVLLGDDVHERVIRWAMARWNVEAGNRG